MVDPDRDLDLTRPPLAYDVDGMADEKDDAPVRLRSAEEADDALREHLESTQ